MALVPCREASSAAETELVGRIEQLAQQRVLARPQTRAL